MVNEKELSLVKKLFKSLTPAEGKVMQPLHDLFVHIDLEKGEVTLYNDSDEAIATTTIYAWVKPEYRTPSDVMIRTLNYAIRELEVEGFWDSDLFEQPLNIACVDKSFKVLEDLYFLDSDMVVLSEPLLAGMDDDLNNFLSQLLQELR